jgi:hypothetical protein
MIGVDVDKVFHDYQLRNRDDFQKDLTLWIDKVKSGNMSYGEFAQQLNALIMTYCIEFSKTLTKENNKAIEKLLIDSGVIKG